MHKISTVLFFTTFFFLANGANALADFPDVATSNPHYAAINELVGQGILKGYEDGNFMPDQDVTRAEAVKIALLGLGISTEGAADLPPLQFSDVSSTDWFYDYLKIAVKKGIVKGYDDGTYKPSQTVNRAEAVKLVLVASGIAAVPAVENAFVDTPFDSWFGAFAAYSRAFNIEPAQTDGRWHPEQNMSRGMVAELVYRMQIVKNGSAAFDEATNWPKRNFPTVSVSLKVPFGWSYKPDGVGAVWLLDRADNQFSLLNPYANGATLLMTRYMNTEGKSSADLFNQIESDLTEKTSEGVINGYSTLVIYHESGEKWREWYVVLPNNTMLNFVAMRGDGFYASYLESYMEKVVNSIEFVAQDEMTIDDIIAAVRSAIKADSMGMDAIDLLDDAAIFETDAIGVGTGPVDYYYSTSADITVKYERSYDVILDVRDGKTSAF